MPVYQHRYGAPSRVRCNNHTVWQTSEDFNRANSSWWVVAVPVVVVLLWAVGL